MLRMLLLLLLQLLQLESVCLLLPLRGTRISHTVCRGGGRREAGMQTGRMGTCNPRRDRHLPRSLSLRPISLSLSLQILATNANRCRCRCLCPQLQANVAAAFGFIYLGGGWRAVAPLDLRHVRRCNSCCRAVVVAGD